jgi:hypothetical protein
MNKLYLLACLMVSVAATAQSGPTVVFTGDDFVYNWQQSAAFTANKNWIGAGVTGDTGFDWGFSQTVLNDFQTNVIDRHPAFVFIDTGASDVALPFDSTPYGSRWESAAGAIIKMVQMAQAAGINVILGNIVIVGGPGEAYSQSEGYSQFKSDHFNGWLQTYATAENIPILNFQYSLQYGVNGPYCPCFTPVSLLVPNTDPNNVGPPVPTDAGYQLITQMAQTAIATYGLQIKGGYLGDVMSVTGDNPGDGSPPLQFSINEANSGAGIQFTPQATWSDGLTRPMLNVPYGGTQGTWTSSDPKVMDVNQHGFAFAYTSGTASIQFKSASGVTFSPWIMTVGSQQFVPEPVY